MKTFACLMVLLLGGAEATRMAQIARVSGEAQEVVERRAKTASVQARSAFAVSQNVSKTQKTMDLDWPGCGQHSGFWAYWCSSTEGCANQKLWLDTPRQQCRYTDEYKLRPENVMTFLPVELKRLEEKSATFASTGCLFGGWWAKCYRRMRQQIRLLKYVRKAVKDAKADANHPAHAYASSDEVTSALERTAANMGQGFKKHEAEKSHPARFDEAFESFKQMPETLKEAARKAEAEGNGLSGSEEKTLEKCLATENMLKMVGTKLSDEQRKELCAQIDAADEADTDEKTLEDGIDSVTHDLDSTLDTAEKEDLDNLHEHETHHDDEDDVGDDLAKKEDPDSQSMLELHEHGGRGSLQSRGTGPLKWIFVHGLGWLISRIAWLLLFLVAEAVGLIRGAVLFPLLFLSCTLSKFLVWIIRDFGYNLLWEGEYALVGGRFMQIGKCAPWMWEAVGFDASQSAEKTAVEIFVQPAQWASDVTGVHHFWKSAQDLCEGVACPQNSACHAGKCLCHSGYYPSEGDLSCQPAPTKNDCVCRPSWTEGWLFTSSHYGCAASGACQVDTSHPSYAQCKDKVKENSNLLAELGLVSKGPKMDVCKRLPFRAEVPRVGGGN